MLKSYVSAVYSNAIKTKISSDNLPLEKAINEHKILYLSLMKNKIITDV